MKCRNCGQWVIVPAHTNKCPYCLVNLSEENKEMTVAQAINKIIDKYGMGILDSPEKVQSMILDYVTGYEREKQIFILSCQKGLLSYAHEILLLKDSEKIKIMARKAEIKLEHDAFMSEEYAILSVNMLLEGMGISLRLKSRQRKGDRRTSENNECKSISSEGKQVVKYKEILLESKNKLENKKDRDAIQTIWDGVNNDDIDALIKMGNCFENGIIVERDLKVAEVFYRKAEELGSQEARNRRNKLLTILSTYGTKTNPDIPLHRTIPLRRK